MTPTKTLCVVSVAIRGESGSYNVFMICFTVIAECSYPG